MVPTQLGWYRNHPFIPTFSRRVGTIYPVDWLRSWLENRVSQRGGVRQSPQKPLPHPSVKPHQPQVPLASDVPFQGFATALTGNLFPGLFAQGDVSRHAVAFHAGGRVDRVAPEVERVLPPAQHPSHDRAIVNAHP